MKQMQSELNTFVIIGWPQSPWSLETLWKSNGTASPGMTLNESALPISRVLQLVAPRDAKCSWRTQLPDPQDPGLHQYINIYNMRQYTSIPLNRLNKAFESGQQDTTQWKEYYTWRSEDRFKHIVHCLPAVWPLANHLTSLGLSFHNC